MEMDNSSWLLPATMASRLRALAAEHTAAARRGGARSLSAQQDATSACLIACRRIVVAVASSKDHISRIRLALPVPNASIEVVDLRIPLLPADPTATATTGDVDVQPVEHPIEPFLCSFTSIDDKAAYDALGHAFPLQVQLSIDLGITSVGASSAAILGEEELCDHHVVVSRPDGSTVLGARLALTASASGVLSVALSGDASKFEQSLSHRFQQDITCLNIHIGSARRQPQDSAEAPAVEREEKETGTARAVNSRVLPKRLLWCQNVPSALATALAYAQHVLGPSDSDGVVSGVVTSMCWPPEMLVPVAAPCGVDSERRWLHKALLLPNRPRLTFVCACNVESATWRHPQAIAAGPNVVDGETLPQRRGEKWEANLVRSPHLLVNKSTVIPDSVTAVVLGSYDYFHYRVDGFADDGWGCAYRSLQSVLSWFQYQGLMPGAVVPSVTDIQRILKRVDYGKESQAQFVGSKEWIGSYEVMMVLCDFVPQVECTLKRLDSGEQLAKDSELHRLLVQHFQSGGPPVMIGGSSYAHTILGIDVNLLTCEVQLLILDPHYSSLVTDVKVVKQKGWCGWKAPVKFFEAKCFYNLCIPKVQYADFS